MEPQDMQRKSCAILVLFTLYLAGGSTPLRAAQLSIHSCDSASGWNVVSPATVSVVPGAAATTALRVNFVATSAPNPGGGPSPGALRLRNTNDDPFYPAAGTDTYGGIRFWVRGDASTKWGNIQFRYGAGYTRAWALFPITSTWTEITIPWREFFQQNFDGPMDTHYKETFWIEYTSGFSQTYGHPLSGLPAQAYEIDDIRFVDGVTLPATPLPQGNSIQKTVNKMKAKQAVKIVVMGASITWGLQSANPAQDHWPKKLETLLRNYYGYTGITVINAAVPAFNSWEGACAAGAFIFNQEPVDLVMAADWCYNDYPDTDQQAFGISQIAKNYEAFFGLVLRRGNSEVMHIQSGLNCEAGKFNLMDGTNTALSNLCDSMNIFKADMYGTFKALGQPWLTANYYTIAGDFAHYNATAHIRVSEIVFDAIKSVSTSNPPPPSLSLTAVFSDHMVLQAGMATPVFGLAAPGEAITVTIASQSKSTTAGPDGKWLIKLDPLTAGGTVLQLKIVGANNTVTVNDVLAGEVWLASGQSNMNFELSRTTNGAAEIAAANYPQIRYCDFPNQWQVCSPSTAGTFSAVAYHCAVDLQQRLGVPVGIVENSVVGAVAQSFVDKATIAANPQLAASVAKHDAALVAGGMNPGQGLTGDNWNSLFVPIRQYGIRGVLWFQGEGNRDYPETYARLLPVLIADWRRQWAQGDFPFLICQLSGVGAQTAQPGGGRDPFIRDVQLKTAQTVANTALIVTLDLNVGAIGVNMDVHFPNKKPCGQRLALAARKLAYGDDIVYSGPIFQAAAFAGGQATVSFTQIGLGLAIRGGGSLDGFLLRAANGSWQRATAVIQGNQVIVSSPAVPVPVAVRYAFELNPANTLMNVEGLPASPFRSDTDASYFSRDDDGGATQVTPPAFTPAAGTYADTQSVNIFCDISWANIYYTINGDTPSSASTPYTYGVPVNVATSTTIKAVAIKAGMSDSAVASAAYTIVSKFTPVVTWSDPADITYPAALGATQLNATTTVAGSFSYTPPSGTVLNPGTGQSLSVQFTPADTAANNSPPPKTVRVNVRKGTAQVTLENLSQTYNGSPRSVSVTTNPAGLKVDVTYGGSTTAPTNPGSYAVAATVNDVNYNGSASGTMTISNGPVIESAPTASPNPATAGQTVQFTIGVSSAPPLSFRWDFGDGTVEIGNATMYHIFYAGTYPVTVYVTDSTGKAVTATLVLTVVPGITNTDSDGDGAPDAQEAILGTNPNDPNSRPGGTADFDGDAIPDDLDSDADGDGISNTNEVAAGTDSFDAASIFRIPMTITKLSGIVKFNVDGKDSRKVSGVIPNLPALFSPAGKTATLIVGGADVSFNLDGKGRAKSVKGTFALKLKGKRNKTTKQFEFAGGDAPFKAALRQGSWGTAWSALGFDSELTVVKAALTLVVDLKFNDAIYSADVQALYSAKAKKGGTFKKIR